LDELSTRLNDAAKKYKEALGNMLKHQESFGKVLLEVYEPIQGKFQSNDSLSTVRSRFYELFSLAVVGLAKRTVRIHLKSRCLEPGSITRSAPVLGLI
jgi:hypothetical protein